MKGYRDMKPMKRSGHEFMAEGGFTGSAGMQTVKQHSRKMPGEPAKPDFKRRAMLPGGLATGGQAHTTSTEAAVAGGTYAKGGRAKRGAAPKHAAPAGLAAPLVTANTNPAGPDPQVGAQAPTLPLKRGGKVKHDDVAQDKALIKAELAKRGLKRGGLSAEANFKRGKADMAKLDRGSINQASKFRKGGIATYSKKPALGGC